MTRQRTQKPSRAESKGAFIAQSPIASQSKPLMPVTNTNAFESLLGGGMRDASTIIGGEGGKWINMLETPNELFPNGGDFSLPFVMIKANYHNSKTAQNPERMIIRIVLQDGEQYLISLPFAGNDANAYPDRKALLDAFAVDSRPIGLLQFQAQDRGLPNPYYRFIYADKHTMELAGLQAQPQADKDVPY